MSVICLCGPSCSGKSTVAAYIAQKYGYTYIDIADSLKDIVANIYQWNRQALSGITLESRAWRETPDPIWSALLRREVTPRSALRDVGTALRYHHDNSIWAAHTVHKRRALGQIGDNRIIIGDLRHPSDADYICQELSNMNIKIFRIIRSSLPPTPSDAHESEIQHVNICPDNTIYNNGTIEDLYYEVDRIME